MSQSSEVLLEEIKKGNESAMELLVKKNYHMVQNFIYRFIGDYNLSYDMTQEVFIKMMKNIKIYNKKDGKFESWLLKIASNHCKDYFRSSSFKQRSQNQNIDDFEIQSDKSVIDILEKNEKRKEVKAAIEKLPIMQREAIILKYYHELKIREICDITGDNENTIKSRLFNGIKNLKKTLLGGEFNEGKRAKIE